ncbi:unnamed protein product [Caenorhabditis angaria]|uniref:MAM domain-containing protein n=1 Tax=Caenorhabditis angaria TaxID=860376 RepID=A0A9P1ILD7_9PELO|nr:unnamed protein product [Caenorhabditis angaria]
MTCTNFDANCRWRNVDGVFVDELDWYQGSGELDEARLAVATATHVMPDGAYAIAATDMVQFAGVKAVLVSDTISCQIGDGEIRFMYWTSPEVQLKVCVKKMAKVYPDFDFCSAPIDKNDPGPVFVTIPDQGPVPFQIYIIADHFTFNSENLKGGFAIIDSIEYYAKMCDSSTQTHDPDSRSIPLIPLAESNDFNGVEDEKVTQKRSYFENPTVAPFHLGVPMGVDSKTGIFDFSSERDRERKPLLTSMVKLHAPTSHAASAEQRLTFDDSDNRVEDEDIVSTVCEAIVCSFNQTETCTNMVHQSAWLISNEPIGNLLTGIRGDASILPYNPNGSFAYVSGPHDQIRLQTIPFTVDRSVTIVFSYYKADKISHLQAILKPADSAERIVFDSPKITKNSRRWFRESLQVPAGNYDYLIFRVKNLRANTFIGIDEMFVVDDRRKSFCFTAH